MENSWVRLPNLNIVEIKNKIKINITLLSFKTPPLLPTRFERAGARNAGVGVDHPQMRGHDARARAGGVFRPLGRRPVLYGRLTVPHA